MVEVLRKKFDGAVPRELGVIGAIEVAGVRRETMIRSLVHEQFDRDVVPLERVSDLYRRLGICGLVGSALVHLDGGSNFTDLFPVAPDAGVNSEVSDFIVRPA